MFVFNKLILGLIEHRQSWGKSSFNNGNIKLPKLIYSSIKLYCYFPEVSVLKQLKKLQQTNTQKSCLPEAQ